MRPEPHHKNYLLLEKFCELDARAASSKADFKIDELKSWFSG